MRPGAGLTRSAFVRRSVGAGVALGLGGARLLRGGSVATASDAPPAVRTFYSRPDLAPPALEVVHRGGELAAGALFLAPVTGPGQRGVLIADNGGEPIWFHPTEPPVTASNFRAAVYRGAPVVTWWEGKLLEGVGAGSCVIADERYRTIARVGAGDGYACDLHEFRLTERGTALITVQRTVEADLRPVGGPREGKLLDTGLQEIDVESGEVLMHWSGLGRIALGESYLVHRGRGPYDYLHLNSIVPGPNDTLLLSARHTWAVYNIDRRSGAIQWRLGGKRSDFSVAPAARFAWQHDALWRDAQTITLFDDGAGPTAQKLPKAQSQSRGLVLDLDLARRRVTLARAYAHHPALLADAMGSFQTLGNGDVLIGWGTQPNLSEYSADGELLLDARLPRHGSSYRAFRAPWVGHPTTNPRLVAGLEADATRLYVSWNGATEVAAWELRAGATPDDLSAAATVARSGFETVLPRPPHARYAAAVALNARGRPLGRSTPIRL
jgi:Arylsulfotransferase (ASST)